LKHPTCAVITCNEKHDKVEYCYQCSSFPCKRYQSTSATDSFISYQHVLSDFEKARQTGLAHYQSELNEKVVMLAFLLNHYNDGRRKNFYCNAVNLLSVQDIRETMLEVQEHISTKDSTLKDKINQVVLLFEAKARQNKIELKLRK